MACASCRVSTHFVDAPTRSLCFLREFAPLHRLEFSKTLPLVALGSWDTQTNHISISLPVVANKEEQELRREFANGGGAGAATTPAAASNDADNATTSGCELVPLVQIPHDGDVLALGFVGAMDDQDFLLSASSTGSIQCFKWDDLQDNVEAFEQLSIPQWEKLFTAAATCLDVRASARCAVSASEDGSVAWLKLDDHLSMEKIVANGTNSRLPINDLKILGSEQLVATVGSTPGSQLKIWDITSNKAFPVAVASDTNLKAILTCVETHPTRPELLITGTNDGRVCFWDQRRLDSPFRTEKNHQLAVSALKLHSSSPRHLYSASEDHTVLSWDFHHGKHAHAPIEYEMYPQPRGTTAHLQSFATSSSASSSTTGANLQVQPLANSFLAWNALDLHVESDTLIAGSDANSIVVIENVSKAHDAHHAP